MLHVANVKTVNWGPFRGENNIPLGEGIYGVVATREGEPGVSNWQGKSVWLGSIVFALTGTKPEACETEDGWITDDEKEGSVELTLSDGSVITRSRKRGKSTQVSFQPADGGEAIRKEAQAAIDKLTGLGPDLLTTCVVRQKQISRMVTATPAERTRLVVPWFGLEPLQEAEAAIRHDLNQLGSQDAAIALDEARLTEAMQEADEHELYDRVAILVSELEMADETILDAQKRVDELSDYRRHEESAAKFSELRALGVALKAKVEAMEVPDLEPLKAKADETRDAHTKAREASGKVFSVVEGDWDGECPLTCSECPVREDIRAAGAATDLVLDDLKAKEATAHSAHDVATRDLGAATRLDEKRIEAERNMDSLRDRCMDLIESVEYLDDHEAPGGDRATLKEQLGLLRVQRSGSAADLVVVRRQLAGIGTQRERLATLKTERTEIQGKAVHHREALAIVGRNGAQREIAESALNEIEAGANGLLAESGLDLQVEVRWSRETDRLADSCDQCGSPFGTSQRVKECDRCGAKRGPKLVEKMHLRPSDRSGAADDFVGLTVQLSAATWLRTKRAAAWSCCLIDEPFAAADPVNARRLSNRIHMLVQGRYGFTQGFVVAHDAAIMEALPKRITIIGGETGSRVEVSG